MDMNNVALGKKFEAAQIPTALVLECVAAETLVVQQVKGVMVVAMLCMQRQVC